MLIGICIKVGSNGIKVSDMYVTSFSNILLVINTKLLLVTLILNLVIHGNSKHPSRILTFLTFLCEYLSKPTLANHPIGTVQFLEGPLY